MALLLQWNVPGSIAFGVLSLAIGLIPALYVLGMRVDVDEEKVCKVFLFGLLRESIPRDQLASDLRDVTAGKGWVVPLAYFMRVDGPGAFCLYPTFVWKSRDVHMLQQLSTRSFSDGDRKRLNGRLIAALVVLGVVCFILLMIQLRNVCGTGSNGSILGLPCH